MNEHYNLYHIFLKDQQAHPMAVERVMQVLMLILQKYEKIYQFEA